MKALVVAEESVEAEVVQNVEVLGVGVELDVALRRGEINQRDFASGLSLGRRHDL